MTETSFGDLFLSIRNGMNIKQDKSGYGLPITRIETISAGSVDGSRVGYAGLGLDAAKDWLLKKGDILFSHINSVEHIGKCAVYEGTPAQLVHGMNLLCLRPDPERLDPRYARWLISSDGFRSRLSNFVNKAVNQASVSITNLRGIRTNVPPIPEQQRISAILDQAEALRAKRRQALAKLDTLVQSIFVDMFGNPATNSKSLQLVSLGDLAQWHSGGTPPRSREDYFSGHIPWFSSGELETLYIEKSREYITEAALQETSAKLIPQGALFLGMYDTAALKASISAVDCSCNQAIAFAMLDLRRALPIYVYYAITIGREHFRRLQRGVRQKNLNLDMVREIKIPLPEIEDQKRFFVTQRRIDGVRRSMESSTTTISDSFATLQHRAFRGEL